MRRSAAKPFALILMPYGQGFDAIYQLGIKAACKNAGADCERVDEQIFDGSILEQIYAQIARADIIIADMTDRNPNVFYEAGYARALDKQIVLLTHKTDDIPYDLRQYPCIVYDGEIPRLKAGLEAKVRWCIKNPKNNLVETLEAKQSFPQQLVRSIRRAKKFVLDMNLIEEVPRELNTPYKKYRQILEERVSGGELSFKRVEVVYSRERLERIVTRLLKHEGQDCFIRHYEPPIRAIPILQLMSFDDRDFYLGGFHSDISPTEEQVLYCRHAEITRVLREYWNVLWMKALPLNKGDVIHWKELKRIALRIGMKEAEYEELIAELKSKARNVK
jgi:hypothetical protein